ncbi:MAG: hypothetical protein J3R72DRAFT_487546 [Linnemannia gamsii]|nr:MAG: hypothetical protein J3R72DRAFT_487546 [Linnemannia gamsii]
MSSIDLPSIHTSFVPYYSSSSFNSTSTSSLSRPYHSPGSSPSPPMTFQSRSYSTSSTSSLLSAYSTSSSDRSNSVSPGPATPLSRSPSLSQDCAYNNNAKPTLPSLQLKHFAPFSPSSPSLSYPSPSYSHSPRHHPYSSHNNKQQELKSFSPSIYQGRTLPPPQFSPSLSSRALPTPSSPRDMYSTHPSRNHIDYYPHQSDQGQQQQQRSPFGFANDYFQSRPSMSTASASPSSAHAYQSIHPLMATPKEEERESLRRSPSPAEEDDEEDDDEYEYATSMSGSRSISPDGSEFSMESSPSPASDHFGSMSEASASMTSLSSTSSSMTPVPTTTQLLLCPVCSRAFKPSKNQNCNLRRHLKNVHNMSPTMHPRKCKWDSLPDGRVKDDKDRKERTRKSKRLWARKYRLRRKVEEAALVLSMLSQAV